MAAPSIIVAVSKNGFIGKNGQLPWRVPEDLRYFKRMTLGHAVIMGRKTYESVGKPLPNRTNIVVARTPGFSAEGSTVVSTIEEALAAVPKDDAEPFIIGGAEIYRLSLPYVRRIYWTEIGEVVDGDVRFPSIDGLGFVETARRAGETPGVFFVTLER